MWWVASGGGRLDTFSLMVSHPFVSFHPGHSCNPSSSQTLSKVLGNSETPQTVARQAPVSMGFSHQGYWSEWPFPPPGALPDLGIKSASPALQANYSPMSHQRSP